MIQSKHDYVIIKIDKEFDDEIVLSSGLVLQKGFYASTQVNQKTKDTTYNPLLHKRIFGKVVSIPNKISKGDLPIYFGETPKDMSAFAQSKYPELLDYKYRDSIIAEVEVGDVIYFHISGNDREYTWVMYEKELYLKIDYQHIICSVRNGEIIPIGGYTMLDEYYGDGVVKEKIGGYGVYVKNIGLIAIPVLKPLENTGIVKHVGTPLAGLECELKTNDKVVFEDKHAIPKTIEGKDYLVLYQHEILMVMDEIINL